MQKHKPLSTETAISWAGDAKALASLLRITPQAIYNWGPFPPIRRQRQIREIFEPKKTP